MSFWKFFDDCQRIVKKLFVDEDLKNKFYFSAINSINWARILFQLIYYFYSVSKINVKNEKFIFLKKNDVILDIGANDGTLLKYYKNNKFKTIGCEPAINLKKKLKLKRKSKWL